MCVLKYDTKIRAMYKLCRILSTVCTEEGVVQTVSVRLLCTRGKCTISYNPAYREEIVVAVQRLVLLTPSEELPVPDPDMIKNVE